MTERPILFSAPMVRALIDGRKTQTRRIVKPQPISVGYEPLISFNHARAEYSFGPEDRDARGLRWWRCPYGAPGDSLWVKETWRPTASLQPWDLDVTYAADNSRRTIKDGEFGERDWTMPKAAARGNVSPLFMPRWASRLTLAITDVRVERLNDCSSEDAAAEGLVKLPATGRYVVEQGAQYFGAASRDPREVYSWLWDDINGAGSWAANPWVLVVGFDVQAQP